MFRNKSCFPSDFFQSKEALFTNIVNYENKNNNDMYASKQNIPKNDEPKPLRKNNSVHNLNINGAMEKPKFIPGFTQNMTHSRSVKSIKHIDRELSKLQPIQCPHIPDFKKVPNFEESSGIERAMSSLKINAGPDSMLYKDYPSYSSSTTNNINTINSKEQQIISIDSSKIVKLRSNLLSSCEMQSQNIMVNLKTLSKKELKNMINIHTTKSNIFRKDSQQNISNSDIGSSPVSPYININKKNRLIFFPSEITQSLDENNESRQSPLELLSPFKLKLGRISKSIATQSVSDLTLMSNCNDNNLSAFKLNEEIKAKLAADHKLEILRKKVNHIRNVSEKVYDNSKTCNNIYLYLKFI